MLRPYKLHSLLALAILSSLLAGLITYRHLSTHAKSLVGDRRQDATVMSLVSIHSNPAEAHERDRLRVEVGYGNLPLSFEPNRGQTDPRVKFLSRVGNRTLWLTSDEAVLAVGRPSRRAGPDAKRAAAVKENQIAPAVLRMKFVGANSSPTIEGEARQSGTVNYFSGKPDQWRTNIATYARVRYHSLYPGIDLVFYGNNRELEYDLVVSPGADPRQIKLAVAGAEEIRIDAEGNLVLKTAAGDVIQRKPKIYQRKGTTLTAVAGDYVITGKNEVGFRLGNYDPHAAVVIDPVLRYSTFLGGSSSDEGTGIAVDSSNRAVVAGTTCSPDFPIPANTQPNQACSVFVTKFDFTGSHLFFSTFIGQDVFSPAVALDDANNIYITGGTFSDRFPTTPGAFQTTFGGDADAFVSKLNRTGTALLYSTFLGGSGRDEGHGIAVDREDNAYVTGVTGSQAFPTTPGVFQRECKLADNGNCSSAFITKLNANGSRALYSTFLGGHGFLQNGNGIAVDHDGHAFVIGFTDARDFPTTAGSAQPVAPGKPNPFATHAFISEVSSSGSQLVYSTYLGGSSGEMGQAIALDSGGNAFVTGNTSSQDFPVKNAFQTHCPVPFGACNAAFVAKLNTNGRLVYSTYLSGTGGELSGGIAATPGGEAYVTGSALDGFPTTENAFQRVFVGPRDVFLTKFSSGGKLIFSSYLGGNEEEGSPVVALDRDTNAYLTGHIIFEIDSPVTFPVTPGALQTTFGGGASDAFAAKVVALCALSTVNRSVTICSPGNGSTVKSPVNIVAGTTDVTPVKLTQVYLDGKKIYETPLSAINVNLPIAGGTHRLTVQGLDTAGVFFKKPISINVSPH
jgi:hypothetical protein